MADWERNVTSISTSIVDAYLNNKLDLPLLKERLVPCSDDKTDDDLIARTCETCDNRVFIGTNQWQVHLESARHRRMVKRKNYGREEKNLVTTEPDTGIEQSLEKEDARVQN